MLPAADRTETFHHVVLHKGVIPMGKLGGKLSDFKEELNLGSKFDVWKNFKVNDDVRLRGLVDADCFLSGGSCCSSGEGHNLEWAGL